MQTIVFDGKKLAGEMEEELRERVEKLKTKGVVPKLVWICTSEDEASLMYGRLKAKAAERVGIEFEKIIFGNSGVPTSLRLRRAGRSQNSEEVAAVEVSDKIKKLNADKIADGRIDRR